MKFLALARSIIAIALACACFSALAHAGRTGTFTDESGRARTAPSPRLPGHDDDIPALTRASAAADTAVVGTRSDIAPGASGAARDRRERSHGRATPNTPQRIHRPVTQRAKGAYRSAPAMPGMGMLLRMSTGDNRELSFDVSTTCPHAPSGHRSGRAPPAWDRAVHAPPAAWPGAARTASLDPAARALLPGSAPSRPLLTLPHAPRRDDAPVPVALRGVPGKHWITERLRRSRAARSKGTAACPPSTPFGGLPA